MKELPPILQAIHGLANRYRVATLGLAYGGVTLIIFLVVIGFVGRSSRASAEAREAGLGRALEEARLGNSRRPSARKPREVRQPREEAPAPAYREYEVQVRDGSDLVIDPSAASEEEPDPTRAELVPEVPPGEAEEELETGMAPEIPPSEEVEVLPVQ